MRILGGALFLCCNLVGFASTSPAAEQRLRFGPNNITVTVNDVRIAASLNGSAVVDSADGDANIDGEITASAKLAELEDRVRIIAGPLLPHDFKGSPCTITINQLNDLKLIYAHGSYELRIIAS